MKWDIKSKRLLILLIVILQITAIGFMADQWDIVKIALPLEIALASWYIKKESDRPTNEGENHGEDRDSTSGS